MVLSLLLLFLSYTFFSQQDKYAGLRERMVKEQIEDRGVTNGKVLAAMRKVPRHLFVPEKYQPYAYHDQALPIDQNQTISQPYVVGFMTAAIEPQSGDKVLEIGTGSGYQAAVLAEIVKEVYTVEIIPELADKAAGVLKDLNYANVHVKAADGFHGWKAYGPYDAIIVTAAAEEIPSPLIEQLKDEGKMIIPIGSSFSVQNLILITKKNNNIKKEKLMPVRFVPFTREEK